MDAGASLSDVAREAKVSLAAASFALNGKPGVSESTRQRVIEVAKRLQYRPRLAAQQLRSSGPTAVGLYIPDIAFAYTYFTEITAGITQELHRRGISLILIPNSSYGMRAQDMAPVDGFIVLEPHANDEGARAILAQSLPVVTVDWPPGDFGAPWGVVESTEHEREIDVLERFVQKGARRPGIILTDRVTEVSLAYERVYLQWCAEQGFEPRVELMYVGQPKRERIEALSKFLAPGSGCDAVFAAGDSIAILIAGAVRALGLEVGTDVLLASEVDSPLMASHTPPITSVDPQPRNIGARCVSLLLELLGRERPEQPVVEHGRATLVKRASG